MKKYFLSAFIAGILCIIFFGVPYFVGKDSTRQAAIEKIEDTYDVGFETDSLHWNWLPVPHLEIYGSKLTYKQKFSCDLPQLKIYPDWKRLVLGKIRPSQLDAKRPHFIINPGVIKKGFPEPPPHPPFIPDINMKEVSLKLDSPKTDNIPALSLELHQGELELKHLAGRLYLTIETESSFSGKLALTGWYNQLTRHYSASANLNDFRLRKLVSSTSQFFSPLSSEVDMQLSCKGIRREEFEGFFSGNLPSFTLLRVGPDQTDQTFETRQTDIRFRKADFGLEKNKRGIFFTARDIALAQPELFIAGRANMLTGKKEPVYQLDLKGREIDLDQVRRGLLDILGDNQITREICDIVRGGKAARASYQFDGPAEDFKDLENMRIQVDVSTSEIHVPEIDLDLDRTGGPIRIADGILTGKNLTTRLGNSFGSNATLAMGLTSDNDLFQFEIDLDADISELPGVLHHLIEEEDLRKEIKKFRGRGRAKAHLSMGDELTDFKTGVDLFDGTNAMINYERFPGPIVFHHGFIETFGHMVEVTDCTLAAGPHHISELSGALSWQEEEPRLKIGKINAEINSADLLAYLLKYPGLKNALSPHLKAIKGNLEISDSEMSGPVLTPDKWSYLLNLGLTDASIITPYLDGKLDLEKAGIQLREDQIKLDNVNLVFRQSPFTIKAGRLSHELFGNWQGFLALSGTLHPEFTQWLRQDKTLPPSLLPATPCKLDHFRIDRHADMLTVRGGISVKRENGELARLEMKLKKNDSDIEQLQMKFTDSTDKGGFDLHKHPAQDKTSLSWQGKIQGELLKTIFQNPPLSLNRLQGDFHIVFPSATGNVKSDGHLQIDSLEFNRHLPEATIDNLSIKGKGPLINIELLEAGYSGEQIEIKGNINTAEKWKKIDLFLSSDFLSRDNIAKFVKKTKSLREKSPGIFSLADAEESDMEIEIQLNCGNFRFSGEDGNGTPLTLTPLSGGFHSEKNVSILTLRDSGLCGLILNGSLQYRDEELQLQEINGTNPEGEVIHFDEILPCLGVTGSMIQGTFTSDFAFNKERDIYNKGRVNINSRNGKILKWGLLARIFQVVNITEMLNLLEGGGFNYDKFTGEAHISNNKLIIDKAELIGHGLDLLARGNIDLDKMSMDVTVYLVPFKTIDAILDMIPLVGRLIQGRKGHIITIPIGVKGDVTDPEVTTLPPKAIGKGAINFIKDTISFPFDILPGMDKDQQ